MDLVDRFLQIIKDKMHMSDHHAGVSESRRRYVSCANLAVFFKVLKSILKIQDKDTFQKYSEYTRYKIEDIF